MNSHSVFQASTESRGEASKQYIASRADQIFSFLTKLEVNELPQLMAGFSLDDRKNRASGSRGSSLGSSTSSGVTGSPPDSDLRLQSGSSSWASDLSVGSSSTSPLFESGPEEAVFSFWGNFNEYNGSSSIVGKSAGQRFSGELLPDEIEIYPKLPLQKVDEPAVFYIETPPRCRLPDDFTAHVQWTSGFKNLELRQDNLYPDRHLCSFTPRETGKYVICVLGKSHEFFVSRNYDGRASDLGFSSSISKIGFGNGDSLFLGKAWGVGVHRPSNTIYLADRENHCIVMLDENAHVLKKFGKEGHGRGQLYRPTGIAVDPKNGRVFITDKDNHRVCIYTLQGNFITSFGGKGHHNGDFNYPWGIAVSPNGDMLAVSDSRNHRIQLFDAVGNFIRKYSVFEVNPFEFKTEFNYPRGISFNMDGSKIYVADFNIHTVFVLDVELTTKTTMTPPGILMRPQGLTLDEAGNILVADSKNNCIRVISPFGTPVCTIDGTGMDEFDMPMDIAVLSGGRVAVTDAERRFRIF